MKAAYLEVLHQPLRILDLETPQPGPGEVVVQLRAAALNHRDVWVQKGLYPGMRVPVVPGSDGAGVVSAVGEGLAQSWRGREVILNPGLGWGENPKAYAKGFRVLGMPENGTFAEFVKIEAKYVHEKPRPPPFRRSRRAAARWPDGLAGALLTGKTSVG